MIENYESNIYIYENSILPFFAKNLRQMMRIQTRDITSSRESLSICRLPETDNYAIDGEERCLAFT